MRLLKSRAAGPEHGPRHPKTALTRRLLLAATLGSLLGACAIPSTRPSAQASIWRGRFSLSWLSAAQGELPVQGAMPAQGSVPTQDGSTAQQAAGRFLLQADATRASLEVASPLGQVMAIASLGPEGASLVTADGQRHQANNAEQLMLQVLGWPAPVQRLPQWLMLPASCGAAPLRFEDAGWRVMIETWEQALPKRLLLRWQTSGGVDPQRSLTLRLIVDERSGQIAPAPACPTPAAT